ncbi:MAG: hypothetical protein WCE87_13120 [Candidatus Udaeobacter sp.]
MRHPLLLVLAVVCAITSDAQESPSPAQIPSSVPESTASEATAQPHPTWFSPDKQWGYRCTDGLWSSIVKADTNHMALDLSNDVEVPYCRDATIVWTPDSKRFAFNYTPPHPPHTTYETVAFYQLRDNKWTQLQSPIDVDSAPATFAKLVKQLSISGDRTDPIPDIVKARQWTDADTAIVYVDWGSTGQNSRKQTFLFTLKFDAEGNSKIVKPHRMSEKELKERGNEQ